MTNSLLKEVLTTMMMDIIRIPIMEATAIIMNIHGGSLLSPLQFQDRQETKKQTGPMMSDQSETVPVKETARTKDQ